MARFVKGKGKEDWEEVLTIREEIERVGGFCVWEGYEGGVWRVCLSAELVSAGSMGLEAIGQVASPLFSGPRSCSSTMVFREICCLPKNKGPLLFLSL